MAWRVTYSPKEVAQLTLGRKECLAWLKQCADRGHAGAQYYLGKYYEKHPPNPGDIEPATLWYRKAAEKGHLEAQGQLAKCLCAACERQCEATQGRFADQATPLHHEALHWCLIAAGRGHAEAQFMLWRGGISENWSFLHVTHQVRFQSLCRALEQGHDIAVEAVIDAGGDGWSFEEIVRLVSALQSAANRGHAAACYALGQALCWKANPHRDLLEAEEWFRRAADLGEPRAIGMFLQRMPSPSIQTLETAEELFENAAGFEQGEPEWAWWLQAAAEKGHEGARKELASLGERTAELLNEAAQLMTNHEKMRSPSDQVWKMSDKLMEQ